MLLDVNADVLLMEPRVVDDAWQSAYERCFHHSVIPHVSNLGIVYPKEFTGNYQRDVMDLYKAVAEDEYQDPHRLPEGVVCPDETGWYHACVYASSQRSRAVYQYVIFVGLDAQTIDDEISPPYIMRAGDRARVTLDMVSSWGPRLPTPARVHQVRAALDTKGHVVLTPDECVAIYGEGPDANPELRDSAMTRVQQAAAAELKRRAEMHSDG